MHLAAVLVELDGARQEGPQEPRRHRQQDDDDPAEVHGDGHVQGGETGPDEGADDGAAAEGGVEVRHDRPTQELLDLGALEVHADVEDAGAETHEEEPQHGERPALGDRDAEPEADEAGALDDRRAHEGAGGAEPVHDEA